MSLRVFGVDYPFLSCGDVFTQGLVHAAEALGLEYQHAEWSKVDLNAVKAFQPDLLFVVHGRSFSRRQKARLHEFHSAIWLLDEPYEVDDTETFSHLYRHVFVCDPSSLHRHPRASYLPTCYDPIRHNPGIGERKHHVGFIGGENATRDRYLAALAKENLLSYVIGGPFGEASVRRLTRSNNIPAADVPDWYRSTQIVLNIFRDKHHYNRQNLPATALNPRIYEATACGALVVSEWRPEIDTLVPELPTFRTVEECRALIADLLAHPTKAEAIRLTVMARLKEQTYMDRLKQVVLTALHTGVPA